MNFENDFIRNDWIEAIKKKCR